MNSLKPKLFTTIKGYSKGQLVKDITAGVIVAIIALPLSIALALASGATPEQGLYTAIVAGFVISFLGGSRVQIAGPTAAFASIVAGVIATNGFSGLVIATIMAGIMLIAMGLLKFGSLIKYIPFTITTGFTSGVALTILIGQIKDFLGLTFKNSPIEAVEKVEEIIACIDTFNWQALVVGMVSLLILIFVPKVLKKIPPSIIAILVSVLLVKVLKMDVLTIGDLYEISSKAPTPHLPEFSLATAKAVLPDAVTIAVLAAVESLLSCVVADGMVGDKHNSNAELVAQGAGNILSALFGGIPATGAIARTAANIKNGGRTPVAGMVHAVVLLAVLLVLMPLASYIPMPTIAAILFMVAYNMSEWREFVHICKTSPKSDVLVLVVTFVLTVVFDLVVAICVGIVLATVLFMKRMSDETKTEIVESECDDNTVIFAVKGSLFFGVADVFSDTVLSSDKEKVIVDMSAVAAIDATGIHAIEKITESMKKNDRKLVLTSLGAQPTKALTKAGIYSEVTE
jgi:SulP family sulfate permease